MDPRTSRLIVLHLGILFRSPVQTVNYSVYERTHQILNFKSSCMKRVQELLLRSMNMGVSEEQRPLWNDLAVVTLRQKKMRGR